jgi:hypothetical protein
MAKQEDLEIVLSALQLAAILQGETIEQSSHIASAFWGATTVLVGATELVGAAALLLTPEPTTITKIAGGALALHGCDTVSAGIVQVTSGQTRTTITAQGAVAAARALGVDAKASAMLGTMVDVAVPLAAGFVGAIRIAAIRRGALSLMTEEAAGGHTLARHVGRTEADLRLRLTNQPAIEAASTFKTIRDAERMVAANLRANRSAIEAWAKTAKPGKTKAFTYSAGKAIGHGVVRATGKVTDMSNVVVVLRKVVSQNRVYSCLPPIRSYE